ncbi:hypothetical protein FEK33_12445 [Nocardia asteroides NBRC 15531]|uniref:Uncharacterized protein n=1 Tax=Nocardia asteroides NBRC 15531 TaxID=1110697 RepID=U5E612_NOCAS|nr:hypothetical protein [Nocardia asteroides]TLF66834.1 hypothetical protein FEK33_12445 [Nocardia asteroides NBRC 15531]UGT51921.1 hypothetical protein LT345_15760 [Nocardia asteroides]SFN02309.1 hypothetical protein SAMN05444423_105392 [Nocardia asteroides]VEG35164.1 Uncharacterised protein [Nocardia asteroides]GAD85287.1 hypothetical protein NCAST_30_00570 [Nocardia asteroides NBRC 15531]
MAGGAIPAAASLPEQGRRTWIRRTGINIDVFDSTAPDVWSLLQQLFSDQPWVVFLAGLLSWVATILGVFRASRHGLRLLSERDDLLGTGIRIGIAAILMVVPMTWIVCTVVWGNLYQYIFTGLFLVDEPARPTSWLGVSVGAVVLVGYVVSVCVEVVKKLLDGAISEALSSALGGGALPGLPAALLTVVHRNDDGPSWAVASGVVFVGGFLVAPVIVAICVRLCSEK